ncbi:MAG: leucine-rich repeat domain-containing protein, partial [Clostridia bacterium]|nr:leucine-rich repeat domain-containing protein [Clostridia bacterium]
AREAFSKSNIRSITIPSSVTSIGYSAFGDCTSLTTVTFEGGSKLVIDSLAFCGCTSISRLHISDIASWCNIVFCSYDSNPLYYAEHLYLNGEEVTDLVIPEGVTSIGDMAFNHFDNLTSITIPSSVTSIGYYAFDGCKNLTNVTFEEGSQLIGIGNASFRHCTSLTSINIPSSAMGIDYHAFQGCTSLTSITIPNSVICVGSDAFKGCTNLENITIEGSPQIGDGAFNDTAYYNNTNNWDDDTLYIDNCLIAVNNKEITSYVIKEGTTVIAGVAFRDCANLKSITIPNSVTGIGNYAFFGCSSLTSVNFEDPNGWHLYGWGFTVYPNTIDVTDASRNATELKKQSGRDEYWTKHN